MIVYENREVFRGKKITEQETRILAFSKILEMQLGLLNQIGFLAKSRLNILDIENGGGFEFTLEDKPQEDFDVI